MGNKLTLEDSLKNLEQVVKSLESDSLSLEDSLKKFEEGIELYKSCKDSLGKAEKRIKLLTESLKEEEFE